MTEVASTLSKVLYEYGKTGRGEKMERLLLEQRINLNLALSAARVSPTALVDIRTPYIFDV